MQNVIPPPMGWNSWYCLSESVSDEKIRQVAAAMVERGLAKHGWSYINIDDCWQGERGGKYNAIQGNERFPDMKDLCEYIHSLGLKIGIYSTPWIASYAGFRGGSTDDGFEKRYYVPENERRQPNQVYPPCDASHMWRTGSEWHFAHDAAQWAEWGFDFVKADWFPNDCPTTRRIFNDLQTCGRDIVLSLSNNANILDAPELMEYSNLVRITGDIHDTWESIRDIGFYHDPRWRNYIRPGHWVDLDMLQIGAIGNPNQQNFSFRQTNLSYEEQKLQFTLWCMLSAPLLLSCDIAGMDDDTFSLVSNDDLIAVDQEFPTSPLKIREAGESLKIYKRIMNDGSIVTAYFNLGDAHCSYEIELAGPAKDLWSKTVYQPGKNYIEIPSHGVIVMRSIN